MTIQEQEAAYRAALAAAKPFDCNVWHAPLQDCGFETFPDLAAQLEACEAAGIRGGIVTDMQAVKLDNYTGNARLRELLRGRPDWYGAMVLTPDVCFDGQGGAYIREMMRSGFCAVRMFPQNFEHSMQEYAVGRVLEELEALGLPLMLWHDQVSWDVMDQICSRHPKLNLIVEAHSVKFLYYARNYFALLQKHDNFYLESHNLVLPQELENIWSLCGKMHVVFGTYFPYANPHFAAFRVLNAGIPDEAKHEILCGAAARLFPKCKEV